LLNTLLAASCAALIVLAAITVGPASRSSGQSTRTTTVKRGVVQSTVSGAGNIESAHQLNLGFKTSGTVTQIYVKAGQHVTQGQLLATLDPKSAEVTLEQAKASLKSAEANLAREEEDEGETSSSQSASNGAAATATTGFSYAIEALATTPAPTAGSRSTTPAAATPPATSPAAKTTTPTNPARTRSPKRRQRKAESAPAPSSANGQSSAAAAKQSAATREANLASARAAVRSDTLTVQSDEQAVEDTRLYAPEAGTVVSLSGEVGETVSGTGTSRASSSTGSSSNSGSGEGGASRSALGLGTAGSGSSGSSQASSQGSSNSAFAVLSDLESLQLVVALSESEIGSVHVGQIATVAIEALSGRKIAAHVANVSQVPTSSSGAVSYDVTFQLDQDAAGLKVGMSATAEVVVQQAEGLNVPTRAIKGGAVTVVRNGTQVMQPVTTGLAGDSSTIILGGLKSGEEIVLPTSATTANSLGSRLRSRLGSRGLGGGLGGGLLGGGLAGRAGG
jgi:multidrug efflux pump subunit AcrA (membrane-fusion protein)